MYTFISAYKHYTVSEKQDPHTREEYLKTFHRVCEESIPMDLSVKIEEISLDSHDRLEIKIQGTRSEDEKFVANILKEFLGECQTRKTLQRDQLSHGYFRDVGKVGFGIFADIGITDPDKEVLIPLYEIREQLVKGQKLSISEITRKYGFIDNFPVDIQIVRMTPPSINTEQKDRIEGKMAPIFIERLKKWISNGNEVVFTAGTPRQMVKRVMAKRGHTQDIIEVQRLGPLETAIILKEGTYATGIVAHIGRFLPNCKLGSLIPAQIRRFWI